MAEEQSTREKLLRAAEEILRDEGFEGFSLRKLGARTGISAPGIYNHFSDRTALIAEVLDRQFFREAAAWFSEHPSPEDATPLLRLRRIMEFYLHSGLSDPKGYRARFMNQSEGDPMTTAVLTEGKPASDASAVLLERVTECLRDGSFQGGLTAGLAFFTIWSALHGAALLLGPAAVSGEKKEEASRAVIDTVLRGLAYQDTTDEKGERK